MCSKVNTEQANSRISAAVGVVWVKTQVFQDVTPCRCAPSWRRFEPSSAYGVKGQAVKELSCAPASACRRRQHSATQRHDVTSRNTRVFQPVPPSRRATSTDGQHSVQIFLLILAVSLSAAPLTAILGRYTILIDCAFPQTPQANSATTTSF